ncbi:thioredoxin-like domain-containing protein [Leptolyngbya sp. FACHB-261]|uniref:thioredoxin-like domain-containing protein n=1 Tax=Leptolyngbya sp. FACHB-261 TaxID=2692806 RepID=UPI001682BD39|nr:thioredoxin-like domain-containing protein [Leptolyngbya sp. FACHB-261]MBD2103534.1 redoxin domain-containing protein [Leptolyngbya sp. FACHB-261]
MIATPRVRAPELPRNQPWLNTEQPLSLSQLRGRVVLLDFWTYCCINCLHVLPDLKFLEQKYRDALTVIGVHSAKFQNEQEIENIRASILRYDIEHPVLVDNEFRVWQEYAVRAWPTLVLIDPEGYYVAHASGEGNRDALDAAIAQLIAASQERGKLNFQELQLKLEKQSRPLTTPLAFPGKVLADAIGERLFIADSGHHRLVVTSLAGEVLAVIGTGSRGHADGSYEETQFSAPQGMVLDVERQWLYVADTDNHLLRRVDLQAQIVTTIAGTAEQSHQIQPHAGPALSTALNSPWDLELVEGRLFIAMAGPHQIWQMDLERELVSTYAGTGAEACVDGPLTDAAFAQPSGITSNGKELFVADSETSTIRAVELGANPQVRTVCGSGDLFGFDDRDGIGSEVRLQHCLGVEYAQGSLWVADTYNHKIKRVDPATGECQTVAGSSAGLANGERQLAQFREPSGLSFANGKLYIADTNNHAIRCLELTTGKVMTFKIRSLCAPDLCFPEDLNPEE